jgi:hypothetical protein
VQGCQIIYFSFHNPTLGKLKGLAKEDVGICYGNLVNFIAIWYISPRFGICIVPKNLATLWLAGGPDWTNFRHLGGCFPWAVFLKKIRRSPNI